MTVEEAEAGVGENLKEKNKTVSCWVDKIRSFILEASTKDHKKATFREQKKRALEN